MQQQLLEFITRHWALGLAFVTLIIIGLLNEHFSQKNKPNALNTAEAISAINHDHAVIIDIRDKESFNKGHIIGSIRIDADDTKKLEKYKKTPLVIVCVRGIMAANLAKALKKQGFTKAMTLNGGITTWQTENLPLIKKK